MNKLLDFIKKILPIILLALIVLEVTFVANKVVRLPFSYIDDTELAFRHKEISDGFYVGGPMEGIKKFFTAYPGVKDGRLAVSYWLVVELGYSLAGFNAPSHYWIHLAMMISSLALVGLIVKKITKNKIPALLSVLTLATSFAGHENWLRLNTQEPIQTLALLALIYLVLIAKKFNWKIVFVTLIFLFSKENSVLYWPIFTLWYLIENKKNYERKKMLRAVAWLITGASTLLLVSLFLLSLGNWTGSKTSLGNIPNSIIEYWSHFKAIYLIHLVGWFVLQKIVLKTKRDSKYFFLFLFAGMIAVGAMLPWKWPLLRYTLTAMALLSVWIGVCVGRMIDFKVAKKDQKRYVLKTLFIAGTIVLGTKYWYVNTIERFKTLEFFQARETSNYELALWISSLPQDTKIGFNIPPEDEGSAYWVRQLDRYLFVYFDREDLKIDLANKLPNSDYVVHWSEVPVEKKTDRHLVKVFSKNYYAIRVSLKTFIKNIVSKNRFVENFDKKEISWSVYQI